MKCVFGEPFTKVRLSFSMTDVEICQNHELLMDFNVSCHFKSSAIVLVVLKRLMRFRIVSFTFMFSVKKYKYIVKNSAK